MLLDKGVLNNAIKCDKCGFENYHKSKYCQECGSRIKKKYKFKLNDSHAIYILSACCILLTVLIIVIQFNTNSTIKVLSDKILVLENQNNDYEAKSDEFKDINNSINSLNYQVADLYSNNETNMAAIIEIMEYLGWSY